MQPTRISAIVQTLEQRVFFAAQTIDAGGDVGQFTSLAINPLTNRPSIAYYDATNGDLKLATQGKSGWSISSVATAGDVGKVNSLKFNRAGEPCVAYEDPAVGALVFARQTHRRWVTTPIDSTGAKQVSLVLDSRGRGRVSYVHDDGGHGSGLRYAFFDGNGWQHQTVEEGTSDVPIAIESSAVALEAKGLPHIAFAHENEDSLGYATTDGSTWTHRAIDTAIDGTIGSVPSIAIDSHDRVHIAYGGEPVRAGGTFYTAAPNDGTTFSQHPVLPTSEFAGSNDSGSTAIAISPRDGKPRIAYFGGDTEPGLRLATGNRTLATTFSSVTIDSHAKDKIGRFPSMAIDDRGAIHIAYYDAAKKDLKYYSSASA